MNQNFFENHTPQEQKTIKANAASAYLLVFISFLFLFNKENPAINNTYVRDHTKSAFAIHLFFLITYIIFINQGVGSGIMFYGFSLNNIIASVLCLMGLGGITYGIYKANSGGVFHIGELATNIQKEKLYDINGDNTFNERDKLTILLSYIPFFGYLNFARYSKNTIIQEATKLNLYTTLCITLFYLFSHNNIANILSLLYIIFVVFVGINLFTHGNLIQLKVPLAGPKKTYQYLQSLRSYLRAYFQAGELKSFGHFFNENVKKQQQIIKKLEQDMSQLPKRRAPRVLIYIPLINLSLIYAKNSQLKYHIRNGLILSLYFLITIIGITLMSYSYAWLVLFLFPILFGISYTKQKTVYQMPYIYCTYEMISKLFGKSKAFNKRYNRTQEVSFKVGEQKTEESK